MGRTFYFNELVHIRLHSSIIQDQNLRNCGTEVAAREAMALSLQLLQQEKALTLSRAAWLLYTFPDEDAWLNVEEYNYIKSAVISAAPLENTVLLDSLPMADDSKDSMKYDPRGTDYKSIFTWDQSNKQKIKVFCDYEVLEEVNEHLVDIELVKTKEDANFWLICEQIKNFLTLPSNVRVCQFPYEGGYVRYFNCI